MAILARLITFGIIAASVVATAAVAMAIVGPPRASYLTASGIAALIVGVCLPVFWFAQGEKTNVKLWIQTLLLIATGCMAIASGSGYNY